MPERSPSLIIYAGGLLVIAVIWILTIQVVHWNLRKNNVQDPERLYWIGLVVLLPLLGFTIYIIFHWLKRFSQNPGEERAFHETVNHHNTKGAQSESKTPVTQPHPDEPEPLTLVTDKILSGTRKNGRHAQLIQQNSPIAIPATSHPFVTTFSLVVLEGPQTGQEFFLNHFPVMIGRGSEALIRLDADLHVSRKHAEIYNWEGTLFLRDLQSTGGTQLNGSAITDDQVIRAGDRIKIGDTVLVLQGIG